MSKMSIRGSEYPLKKIFSDDFVFTIPLYQRAYEWTTEEAEDLLQDLLRAMEGFTGQVDDLSPYFLGSIVLIKGEESDAQVIDGQQRLTTLTMLLSALRSLIRSEYTEGLTKFLCEKGNVVTNTPTRYRLRLRERDADFFQRYIQDEQGIEKLKTLSDVSLIESQRNIRENTLSFIRDLQNMPEERLIALTQFIINRCFLIIVAVDSPDLDSAYRIFSVLNNRGLNLSIPDILKSEVLSTLPKNLQDEYAKKWEDMEALLEKEFFEQLFIYLRAIFARERDQRGIIEEFHIHIYPGAKKKLTPQSFIDDILIHYAQALNIIVKANYQHRTLTKSQTKEINTMFRLLNNLDYKRWIPPTLYYFFQYWREPELLLRFLKDMERLVVYFVLCKVPPFKRMDRYYELLNAIYHQDNLFAPKSPLQLTRVECEEFVLKLNGDLYRLHHICRYMLLRLDAVLSDGSATYEYERVSVEHVLPQRPAIDSEWQRAFPTKEIHAQYVHRLGNLVLLSRTKNIEAENFDFDVKKSRYFSSANGISPFVLTTDVLRQKEWTPRIVEQRQERLLMTLKQLWRL